MREKFLRMTPELHEYLIERGARQDAMLSRVERETEALGPIAAMQIAPDQGALITLLLRSIGARRALEVGTFTGYSAICIARGLPGDGRLVCCEISDEWADAAERNLAAAGVESRVEIRRGPALETLHELQNGQEAFDFAFVDADKVEYPDYYEAVLGLLRPGGLAMLDNMLRGGTVVEPEDEVATALDDLNAAIAGDERVDCVLLGVADGITLVRKR